MKISAQNLIDFASKYQADRVFPELIRRLIRATSDGIEDVFFPSGESTFRPGADGELRALGKDPYVPDGASIWELSTESSPHVKGKRDLDKRSAADARDFYMGKPRSEVTYVAVSMRRWSGEGKVGPLAFAANAKAEGVWKDVRVIDADHLEEWIDRTPSVAAWLAREMGLVSADMQSIEHAWDDYSKGCSPPLKTELLLANREAKAEALVQAGLTPGVTRIKADSPGEAAAFVAAAILALPPDDAGRRALLAKGVVISEPSAAHFLSDTENRLFIIAMGRASQVANMLAERGHTVVVPYGTSHSSSRGSPLMELPRARRHEFAQALVAMGMSEEAARNAAASCHCSITVLRRASDQAQSILPEWATPKELRKLVGPLFCGAWDHENSGDTAIVGQVGDAPYLEIEQSIQDALILDDAPVLRAGKLTTLSAPADIWQLSIDLRVVNMPLLDRFRDAAITVLGELDPALELPVDKRAYADIYDKRRVYSGWLRKGMAEVLRLIAVNDDRLGYIHGFSAQHYVDGILKGLPGLATDYRMLASLDSLLPHLAEAAPAPFLAALETLTMGDGAQLSPIFEGSDEPIFGRTYYLGTLRALETISWDPSQLARATQVLARLAQLDPGGRLTNRPINSLVEIFLPWNPHTNATEAVRHSALTKVCERYSDVGWALLAKLLPNKHQISTGTMKAEWREMGASERPIPTYGSMDRDNDVVFRLARSLAGTDAGRWLELVTAAGGSRNTDQFYELLSEIDGRSAEFAASGQSKTLWEGLRALVAKHERFATADWAMTPEMVARLQQSAVRIEPADLVALHRHLFSNSLIDRVAPGETFEQRSVRSKAERDQAIGEISKGGVEEILRLAREVKSVSLLAPSLVDVTSPEFCRDVVLASCGAGEQLSWLATVLMSVGVSRFGFGWGRSVVELAEANGSGAETTASLIRAWEDSQDLLDYVLEKDVDVQAHYWAMRDAFVRTDDMELLDSIVRKLSEHGRNAELVEFLGGRLEETGSELFMDVLSRALMEALSNPQTLQHVDGYWLREIFAELKKRADVDRSALMGLEYQWLPAIHSYGETQTLALHEHLGASPEFFVEVLSDLYKADWEVASEDENDVAHLENDAPTPEDAAQRRGKAEIAYKILDSWRQIPWLRTDGLGIDYSAMVEWVQSSLALAKSHGRHGVASSEIGKLLAYAPSDVDDGLWPVREVRDLIEELANPELESGLVTELFNKRGVHTRSMDGGGDQERELAAVSRATADAFQSGWPRTSAMMRENAKQWIHHGEWEDRRASEQRISL